MVLSAEQNEDCGNDGNAADNGDDFDGDGRRKEEGGR